MLLISKNIQVLLLIFCLLALTSTPARSSAADLAGEYRIGVQNFDYFPHYDFTDDTQDSYIEEFIKLFREHSHILLIPVPLPTKRLEFNFFENRDLDLIYPANARWYRSQKNPLYFSHALLTTVAGTMVINTGRGIDEIGSISIPFGFTPVKWLKDSRIKEIEIFGVPSALKALQMVASGRTDAADVEYNVARNINHAYGLSLVLDPNLPVSYPEFQIASIKRPRLIQTINQFIVDKGEELTQLKRQLEIKEGIE